MCLKKIKLLKMKVRKLQEGGQMPQDPGQQGGGSPEEQIMMMAQQIIQELGPEAAAILAQAIMEMLQGGEGGQDQAPQGEPVYAKKGGKLVIVGRK